MIRALVGIVCFAVLFVVYGLLMRGRQRTACHDCSCRGGICERTGELRHLELVEHTDVRS
jgi:hypothetical protein